MKKTIVLYVSFLICASFTQAQQSTFTKVFYDMSGDVQGYSIIPTSDSNYIIAGEKDYEAMALKMDDSANILWSRKFGSSGNEHFNAVASTSDSCYILAGRLMAPGDSYANIFYTKINSNGDTLWSKVLDFGSNSEAFSIQQTNDKGYIITGNSSGIIIAKLDSVGNAVWSKVFTGGNHANYAYSIKQTADSGYVVTGYIENYTPFDAGMFLMKLTPSGTISWAKKHVLTSPDFSQGCDVLVRPDGYLCYLTATGQGSIVMKTDLSGNVLWAKSYVTFSGSNMIGGPMPQLYKTSDSCYIFVTYSNQFSPGTLAKIDTSGTLLWNNDMFMRTANVVETADKGYIVLGNGPLYGVKMSPTYNPQIGIIKTDSIGYSVDCVFSNSNVASTYTMTFNPVAFTAVNGGVTSSIHPAVANAILSTFIGCVAFLGDVKENITADMDINIYPNPASNKLNIEVSSASEIEILNIQGQLIKSITANETHTSIDVSGFANGMYFIKVKTEKGIGVKKFVKE